MKHNWEYKRLGDICTVIGGSTPKTDVSEYWNGLLNWFTPAEISDKKYYSDSERKITPEAVKAAGLTLMPAGTVLLTSRAPIGKVGITTIESYCNQGFKNFVCGDSILNEYLYYALIHFNDDIKGMGHGATFKEISKKTTENIEIPVPPMAVQQRIVEELDKINEVIDDCRELLRNLDALAQSLFNDYFGDPITNPKGWTLKQIKSFLSLKAGKAIKASELLCHISDGYYPCYGGNGIRGYISRKSHHGLYNIIGRQGALCGNVTLANSDFYATEHAVVVTPLIATSPYWLYYLLTALNLNQYAKGVAQPGLSVGVINEISIPVPPLELQEKFAERIEQIEAQKKVLENTIAELQTLLDSRMDYWFN